MILAGEIVENATGRSGRLAIEKDNYIIRIPVQIENYEYLPPLLKEKNTQV